MNTENVVGRMNSELHILELNPLKLQAWFYVDGVITNVIIDQNGNEFLADFRNGHHTFSLVGEYNSKKNKFTAGQASPVA